MSAKLESTIPGFDLEMLDGVGAEVLGTMFFTEAVAAECAHAWLENALGVQVRFNGTHCGEMMLGVSRDAAESMAAGFLGVDQAELTEAQLHQVMLELANIMCGAAMSKLWPDSSLLLDPPVLADARRAGEGLWHRCFTLEEGMLAIAIRLEGDAFTVDPEDKAA